MRAGIMMIGSLLWEETEHREEWRRERLDLSEGPTAVLAPIRYGRSSENRAYTYTMVLSRLAARADYGLGSAWVAPCRREVSTIEELSQEARALWVAESKEGRPTSDLCATWGAVGILFREAQHPIRESWARLWKGKRCPTLDCARSEHPIINGDGTLAVRWPTAMGNTGPVEMDVLLATATKPTLIKGRYPRASQIARAWINDTSGRESYFFKNIERGIGTFQDRAIWRHLSRSDRGREYRERYPRAADLLESAAPSTGPGEGLGFVLASRAGPPLPW